MTRRGDIIGSVRAVDRMSPISASRPAALLASFGVQALDVEGVQPFVDERGKLERQVVARLQVVALEQVNGPVLPDWICLRTS